MQGILFKGEAFNVTRENYPDCMDHYRATGKYLVGQGSEAAFHSIQFWTNCYSCSKKQVKHVLEKRLLSAYNLEKRAPIQWGLTHEKTAIQEYCKVFEVNVLQTGIWLHESGVLGASPDGFVQGNPKNITERVHQQEKNSTLLSPDIVEVKCQFSARSMTIKEACSNVKDFFLDSNPSDNSLHLRTQHDYWHQIQGQLYLTGSQCCDLVVWTQADIQVVRIEKDASWSSNILNMIKFYYKVFLPSL
eukprot:XP_011437926.1 PREDICTED: uncharacterized protein LOC105335642 [Crassostrea gigas]